MDAFYKCTEVGGLISHLLLPWGLFDEDGLRSTDLFCGYSSGEFNHVSWQAKIFDEFRILTRGFLSDCMSSPLVLAPIHPVSMDQKLRESEVRGLVCP